MKLDRLILVNWGALRSGEYPMGNMTLLTGPSGAGKSTILDALQTVMTAVYANIFSYNPSQGETTQTRRDGKTKRTLWSYIVGAEDNLFARPDGAHGYIGAVFKPSEGEQGKEFTALIAASARVDGSGGLRQAVGEKLNLLIIDDAALSVDDLYRIDNEDNMWVVEVERIESVLSSKYPKVLNLRELKREYLCQLYGRFRGMKSVSFQEAEAAAKAWCQAIALPKIDSVDDLVKHQILGFDVQQLNQRISHIAELMQQIHALREEGERLQENVRHLTGLEEFAGAALQGFEGFALNKLVGARRALIMDQQAILEATNHLAQTQLELSQQQEKAEAIRKDLDGLQQQMIQVQAQLMGIPAAAQKEALEFQLDSVRLTTQAALKQLQVALTRGHHLQVRANQLLAIEFPREFAKVWAVIPQVSGSLRAVRDYPLDRWALLAESLAEQESLSDGVRIRTLTSQVEVLRGQFEPLHAALTQPTESLAAALSEQRSELVGLLQTLEGKEQEAAGRKASLASGGTDYPGHIRRALQCFREALPGVKVQVLCDLIEPLDEAWQPAIESYMGDARFNLLVAPECEEDATSLVKQRQLATRVIQGAKCMKEAREDRVHPESIVHDLQTGHPVAKAYLIAQFGDVRKVRSAQDLQSTSRGVMQDGRAAGSRTTYHARVQDLVFGQAQRRLALERALEAHNTLVEDVTKTRGLIADLVRLQGLTNGLQLPEFDSLHQIVLGVQDIDRILNSLDQLDLTAFKDLDDQRQSLAQEIKAQEQAQEQVRRQVARREETLQSLENTIVQRQDGLAARETSIVEQETRIQGLCLLNPALSFLELADKALALAEAPEADQADTQGQACLQRALAAQGDLREGLGTYNQRARSGERLEYNYAGGHSQRMEETLSSGYAPLVTLLSEIRDQLRYQRDTGLYKNLAELRQAESSFRDVFTQQFCYEIRNAVDTGVKTLKALNAELSHLKFGTDRFYLDWSTWVPEFKAYYDFFEAAYVLADTQEAEDLFTTAALSPAHCLVRDRLVHLLLSEDQDKALQELRRIADYRNYRRYEIWKESDSGSKVALSTWGTGSGGQLQTPSYIIQAAVVVNRLKHFEKGPALKLLVNDESFHCMDETRTHDVLRFLRDSLGLQFICAMPTKNAGPFKPEFTKEWCVTRTSAEGNGEVSFVAEADERDLNPDTLRELWDHRRHQVRTQATLLFEEANPQPAEA